MKSKVMLVLLAMVAIAGCASSSRVYVGVNEIGKLRVTTTSEWRSIDSTQMPAANGTSRTWTKTGVETERLMLISGITSGASIFRSGGRAFSSGMSSNEIAELVEESLPVLLSDTFVQTQAGEPREQAFGQNGGIFFEFSSTSGQQGLVGAFEHEEQLFVSVFVAADASTFSQYGAEAEAVITSASTRLKTIGRH